MSRAKRSDVFDPDEVGVYHCFNRIVRGSYLCGFDKDSGKDYSHRRDWLYQRLKYFTAYFAIDILGYVVLSNHYHIVLRNRPDEVEAMSDREVVAAWLMICPQPQRKRKEKERKEKYAPPDPPTDAEIQFELQQPGLVTELRSRLSNPSWLIRQLDQYMGIRCNAEDEASGHFWEARFGMKRLLDEAAVLACLAYVDLNPLRGRIAKSLEEYPYVSIGERLRALDGGAIDASSWLAPIALKEETNGQPVMVVNRLGQEELAEAIELQAEQPLGCLPIGIEQYAELLRWLAKQGRTEQTRNANSAEHPGGGEPSGGEPPRILIQLGLDPSEFSDLVQHFDRRFYTAVGCATSLRKEAARRGKPRLNGPGRHALSPRRHAAAVP